jgi:hypothetical protein
MDKTKISAKQVLRDIRAGLDDEALMQKHEISVKGLYRVFTMLVLRGILDAEELEARRSLATTIEVITFKCRSCGLIVVDRCDTCPRCCGELKRLEGELSLRDRWLTEKTLFSKDEACQFALEFAADVKGESIKRIYDLDGRPDPIRETVAKQYHAAKKSAAPKPSIKISASEALKDIKLGLDDQTLMRKYDLTARQLQRLFRKIIRAGYATTLELSNRLCITRSQVTQAFEDTMTLERAGLKRNSGKLFTPKQN